MDYREFKYRMFEYLGSIKGCMEKLIEPIVSSQGLTLLQAMILLGIKNNLVNNITSLNKELGVGQANASTICKKLEKLGFIRRIRDSGDERIVTLHLTQKAEDAILNMEKKGMELDPVLKEIPPQKLELIINGFSAMEELLTQLGEAQNSAKRSNNEC